MGGEVEMKLTHTQRTPTGQSLCQAFPETYEVFQLFNEFIQARVSDSENRVSRKVRTFFYIHKPDGCIPLHRYLDIL